MAKIVATLLLVAVLVVIINKRGGVEKNGPSQKPPTQSDNSQRATKKFAVEKFVVENKSSIKGTWADLNRRVHRLDDDDQRGLTQLYSEAKNEIERDPKGVLNYFKINMPSIVQQSFINSFFEASSWIRFSPKPTAIVEDLLDFTPPADSGQRNVHHEELTPAVRYRRLEAYAVRELRKQYESGNITISTEAKNEIVPKITARAASEKSLDVSLEMVQFLKDLGESKAVEIAVAGHSPRDQAIITGVVGSP